MPMVKYLVISLITILLFVTIFAPKKEIFFMIERQLLQHDVIIDNESIEVSPFSLTLKDAEIYLKGIKVAKIGSIDLFTLLLFSSVDVQGVDIDNSLKRFVPTEIEHIEAHHSILKPLTLSLDINGTFGETQGYIDINEQKVHLDLIEEGTLGTLRQMLKKGQDGWYYETSF